MSSFYLKPAWGVTLEEIIQSFAEGTGDSQNSNEVIITLFPPTNSCTDLRDEDSRDEDSFGLNNFPASQLSSTAEISTKQDCNYEDINEQSDKTKDESKENVLSASEDSNPEFNIRGVHCIFVNMATLIVIVKRIELTEQPCLTGSKNSNGEDHLLRMKIVKVVLLQQQLQVTLTSFVA